MEQQYPPTPRPRKSAGLAGRRSSLLLRPLQIPVRSHKIPYGAAQECSVELRRDSEGCGNLPKRWPNSHPELVPDRIQVAGALGEQW